MPLFWSIILCQILFSIALRGSRPIVTLYADMLGASPLIIGLLIASFSLLPMIVAIKMGKWLDNYGAKRLIIIGGIGMFIALFLPILSPNLIGLFANQLLIGIGHVCVLISLQKTMGNLEGNRDKLIAYFSIAGAIGEFIGPLLTGVIFEQTGLRWTFFIMVAAVAVGLILIIFARAINDVNLNIASRRSNSGTWKMLKQVNLRKALIISGLVLYSKDLFVGYFPVYGNNIGLSPSEIGLVVSLLSGVAVFVRFFQYNLVNWFGRGLVLLVTLIISGVAFIFIPLTESLIVLMLLSSILGVGLGLGQPLSIIYTLNVSPTDRHGEVLGLRLTFNRGSQFVAPFIFGGIGQLGGIVLSFLISGGVLIIGAYLTRMKGNEDEP